jgi:hypothetical protein
MAHASASESTPLLRSPTASRPTTSDSKAGTTVNIKTQLSTALSSFVDHLQRWRNLYITLVFIFLIDLFGFLGEIAKIRVYEGVICRQYYQKHDPSRFGDDGNVPEKLCKIPDIQSNLAQLRGIMSFLEESVTILFVVPYGIVADIYGRKLIALIAIIGMLLADMWVVLVVYTWRVMPAKSILAANAFKLIGGGNNVALAMFYALVADITPPKYR